MLLSLARDLGLVLELCDIKKALEVCMGCVSNIQRLIAGIGRSADSSNTTAIILEELIANKEMSRARLLSRHYGDFYADELDRVVETMMQARAIDVERRGEHTIYRLKPKILEYYRKKQAIKEKKK